MSFSSNHSWSTSDPLWNFNDMFERSPSGPQDASFSAIPSCPSPNSLSSWLDPSLFEESGGLHTTNENIDGTNSFPYTDSLNEENRITDASTRLGDCGQAYTPSTTIAATTGFVSRNGIGHVPQYNKLSSSANINQTDSALNTRSSDAYLEGFRDGAGLLPSNVSSLRYTQRDNDGTNTPIMHNHNLMDPNAYSRVLGLNTVPQASTYPLPPHGPAFWQLNSSSPLALPPPTANVLFGQSPVQMQPRFPIHPNTLGGSYVPLAYTNSLAIDATNRGVGYQHSICTSTISPTIGHTVSAVMPHNKAPSTSEEPSSVDLVPRRTTSETSDVKQYSEPSPTSPSSYRPSQTESSPAAVSNVNSLVSVPYTNTEADLTPNPETSNPNQVISSISKKNAAYKEDPKQQRRRQLYPSQDLWVKTRDGRYACRYNGPATSEPCAAIVSTPRNLGRHMREVHARQEMKLKIPDSERIAVNGMPVGLRTTRIVCPYSEEDLDKCRYYREEGRRWEIKAMNRGANFLRQHILCYHREEM